jgi:hypothetical protein
MQEVPKITIFSTLLALFNNMLNSLQRYDGVTERFCVSADITSKFRTVTIFESLSNKMIKIRLVVCLRSFAVADFVCLT